MYFENGSILPVLQGFIPRTKYSLIWYNPSTGEWKKPLQVMADDKGTLKLDSFPDSQNQSAADWALKVVKN